MNHIIAKYNLERINLEKYLRCLYKFYFSNRLFYADLLSYFSTYEIHDFWVS